MQLIHWLLKPGGRMVLNSEGLVMGKFKLLAVVCNV